MSLNIERLTVLRDVIANLPPSRFKMSTWVDVIDEEEDDRDSNELTAGDIKHDCGTCACIGGWTDALFREPKDRPMQHSTLDTGKLLGLTGGQTYELFTPKGVAWIEVTQEKAAEVLTRLIETGRVDWSNSQPDFTEVNQ